MRKQLLAPLTAAAVAAGTLTLANPSPAGAAAWLDNGPINGGVVGNATSLDVASTGPGDAIAAWTVPVGDVDRVFVARADNGGWGSPSPLSPVGQDTRDVHVATNPKGEAIVTWEHPGGAPDHFVLSARRLTGGTWGPATDTIVPTPSDASLLHDVALDGSGDAVIAYRIADDADSTAFVTDWPKAGDITASPVDAGPDDEFAPTLAANNAGDVLYSFARGSAIWSTYRPAGSNSWTEAVPVVGSTASQQSSAVLRPDGSGVVASVQNAAPDVLRVVRIGANGVPGQSTVVSDPTIGVINGSVSANADGDVFAAWGTDGAGNYGIDYATSAAGGAFSAPQTLVAATGPVVSPLAAVTDQDLRVVITRSGDNLDVHHRAGGVQAQWQEHDAGPLAGWDLYALDTDAEGNVVVVGSGDNGVHAEFLDAAGPRVKVVKPSKAISVTDLPTIGWSTSDSLSGIEPTVDVYATTAAWNAAGHGGPSLIVDNAAGDKVAYQATPGTTYCFQVRAQDTAGNFATSPARCSTVPLDDRLLAGKGWTRAEGNDHFLDTVTRTSKKGKTLVRKGVQAKRLSLVVHKTLKSGSVKVTFDDLVLGTFSLKGKGKHRVINLVKFPTVRAGTVRITVASKGKPVNIDGLVVIK